MHGIIVFFVLLIISNQYHLLGKDSKKKYILPAKEEKKYQFETVMQIQYTNSKKFGRTCRSFYYDKSDWTLVMKNITTDTPKCVRELKYLLKGYY